MEREGLISVTTVRGSILLLFLCARAGREIDRRRNGVPDIFSATNELYQRSD